jgi:hypothetical protein
MKLPAFLSHASRSGPPLRVVNSIPFPGANWCPVEEVWMTRAGALVSSWDFVSAGSYDELLVDIFSARCLQAGAPGVP